MQQCIILMVIAITYTHPDPSTHKSDISRIANNICRWSKNYSIDPYIILSIIRHESFFKKTAVSKTNDYGLMQINIIHKKCNLLNTECNIRTGSKLLLTWMIKHRSSKYHWLRRYNWNNYKHHLRVLWLIKAYKYAMGGHKTLYKTIKYGQYKRLRLSYSCIERDLCGFLKDNMDLF
jgi:hypothetical protein